MFDVEFKTKKRVSELFGVLDSSDNLMIEIYPSKEDAINLASEYNEDHRLDSDTDEVPFIVVRITKLGK